MFKLLVLALLLTFSFPIFRHEDTIVDMRKVTVVKLNPDSISPKKIRIILDNGENINFNFSSKEEAELFMQEFHYWKLKESGMIKL